MQLGNILFRADRALESRTFALDEIQAEAHCVGDGQDVREQDGGVERETFERLKRDFRRVIGIGREAEETAGARTRGVVLGQVAARLAH